MYIFYGIFVYNFAEKPRARGADPRVATRHVVCGKYTLNQLSQGNLRRQVLIDILYKTMTTSKNVITTSYAQLDSSTSSAKSSAYLLLSARHRVEPFQY
jgi:hypothetical protein